MWAWGGGQCWLRPKMRPFVFRVGAMHRHPRTPAAAGRWGLGSSDGGISILMGDIEAENTDAPGMSNTS